MSFGNIVGQLLQQGMAGQSQTRGRLERAAGQSGGGMDQMLGALLGGGGAGAASAGGRSGSAAGGLGGLADLAQQFLGSKQVGGMTGAQAGGLGALVGAVLGGGGGAAKGAVGGGAMAILGTLALTALKNYQASASASAADAPATRMGATPPPVAPEEAQAVTDPATEKLIVRAMISAAKSDGQVDQTEMQRIVGQIDAEGVTDAERQFVIDEMTRPLDLNGLVAEVRTPAVAAEVYAASILAIDIDSEAERQYLRDLAHGLRLDHGTVQRLHQLTGAPAV
jgi:uncharacterized membrane protein YebE (DUF533 family)